MGIPVGGRSMKEVRDQTERISRCRLTFEIRQGNRVGMANQNIVESAIFLEAADPAQGTLFAQHARLSEAFFPPSKTPGADRRGGHTGNCQQFHGLRHLRVVGLPPPRPGKAHTDFLARTQAAIRRFVRTAGQFQDDLFVESPGSQWLFTATRRSRTVLEDWFCIPQDRQWRRGRSVRAPSKSHMCPVPKVRYAAPNKEGWLRATRAGPAIERYLSRLPPRGGTEPTLIVVHGGLPEELQDATAGRLRFVSAPGEPFDEFKDRVLDAAAEAGESFVVIGGLPRPQDGTRLLARLAQHLVDFARMQFLGLDRLPGVLLQHHRLAPPRSLATPCKARAPAPRTQRFPAGWCRRPFGVYRATARW